MKFIRPKYFTEKSTAVRLHNVQVNNKKKHKALNQISSVSYLQSQLRFDNFFLKHAQYIQTEKKLNPVKASAISNIVISIGRVIKNCLQSVFWSISFRNYWRFMWQNTYSMASWPNWINSRRLAQKLLRKECTMFFVNTTFILEMCT